MFKASSILFCIRDAPQILVPFSTAQVNNILMTLAVRYFQNSRFLGFDSFVTSLINLHTNLVQPQSTPSFIQKSSAIFFVVVVSLECLFLNTSVLWTVGHHSSLCQSWSLLFNKMFCCVTHEKKCSSVHTWHPLLHLFLGVQK